MDAPPAVCRRARDPTDNKCGYGSETRQGVGFLEQRIRRRVDDRARCRDLGRRMAVRAHDDDWHEVVRRREMMPQKRTAPFSALLSEVSRSCAGSTHGGPITWFAGPKFVQISARTSLRSRTNDAMSRDREARGNNERSAHEFDTAALGAKGPSPSPTFVCYQP